MIKEGVLQARIDAIDRYAEPFSPFALRRHADLLSL